MRLATKIFLLLFGLFFTTLLLDIVAQYYFYDFAYPGYKQNQIYRAECATTGIRYIDTSQNRSAVLARLAQEILRNL